MPIKNLFFHYSIMSIMKFKYTFLAHFICLLIFISCKEEYIEPKQAGTLKGKVLHGLDYTPIENAIIKMTPFHATVLTDADGSFIIESVPVGGYTLEVRKEGYKKELLTVQVVEESFNEVDILLSPEITSNTAPNTPINLFPGNYAENQEVNLLLRWRATDINENDELKYTLYFFKEGQPNGMPLAQNITDTFYQVNNLEFDATYHWQVEVTDQNSSSVFSPVWTFKTVSYPLHRFRWTRKVDEKFQIFCSDEQGNILQMTHGPLSCWRPRLSPDRKRIAFLSNQGIEPHLFVMDTDGSNVEQITEIPVAGVDILGVDFCWSPNSTHLLYVNNDRLFSIRRDGTDLHLVAQAPDNMQFASVDWTEHGNLKVVRLTGTNVYQSEIRLLDEDGNWTTLVEDEPGKTGNAVFSLDGTKILYTHDVSGFQNLNGRQLNSHIFMLDVTTGEITDLSVEKPAGTNDLDPRFSPNGSQVIFTNTSNDGISTRLLYKVDLSGSERELIVDDAEMGDWY